VTSPEAPSSVGVACLTVPKLQPVGAAIAVDFDLHALKRIDHIGVTFRTRSVEEVRAINAAMRADIWDAVEAGTLRLPIDRTFPLEQAAEAQAYMRANAHFGKIVLTV